jgi:hypothetical protein
MKPENELQQFVKLMRALEPWLGDIVIVGGWAHRLYRFHQFAQPLEYKALITLDTDIAVPENLPADQQDIAQRLHDHGFTETFLGDHQPPVTHYRLGPEQNGFYPEFLTPLQGSGHTRKGKPDKTVRVAGVSSQKLRHVDVLLRDPWEVSIKPDEPSLLVRVANPTAFIVQKLLICDKRGEWQLAKDVLYIHDTIELFGANLARLTQLWQNSVSPHLHRNHVASVHTTAVKMFSGVSDRIRDASQIARAAGRTLPPEDIQGVCNLGLEAILEGFAS